MLTLPTKMNFRSKSFDALLLTLEQMYDQIYVELTNRSHFVDRGDPSVVDFDETDLTTDGIATWRDLDLSSIIPIEAYAVLLHVRVLDDAAGSTIRFRKNGNSNVINTFRLRTQVADVNIETQGIVSVDTSRIIEYAGSAVTFTAIDITVCGWWVHGKP